MKPRPEKKDTDFSARISFSFRTLHKKSKLMQGLSQLESLVKDVAINSEKWGDSVPIFECSGFEEVLLEDLLFTAHNVNQLFSHPLRILPASSIVELPQTYSPGNYL